MRESCTFKGIGPEGQVCIIRTPRDLVWFALRDCDLSMMDIAVATDHDISTVSTWKCGKREPKYGPTIRLIKALVREGARLKFLESPDE